MSKENTKKFLDDVSGNESLRNELLGSNAQAWIASAKSKGLDITAESLADELIASLRNVVNGELSDSSLDEVSGGAGPAASVAQRKIQVTPQLPAGALRVTPNFRLPGKGAARW
jgi:predicted ribosomally synthesized peptide with nif11-like leader